MLSLFVTSVMIPFLLPSVAAASTITNCPLQGPIFPAPSGLSSSSTFQSGIASLKDQIDTFVESNSFPDVSFAIEVFSANEDDALFQYFHTAPSVANSTTGVNKVDSHSVWRVASISKLFAAYTFLIEAGDGLWNQPVTKYVPELAAAVNSTDGIDHTAWDQVTLGALASHMAGIGRDYAQVGLDVPEDSTLDDFTEFGLPPLSSIPPPPCGVNSTFLTYACGREAFLKNMANRPPAFAPYTTPAYSNAGYSILAYALEGITGKDYSTMLEESVIKPLNLTDTTYTKPPDSRGVIPSTLTNIQTLWNRSEAGPGDESATGAAGQVYSSTGDLVKLGQAILGNKLLTPLQTRQWMKPVAFTADNASMVGMPWEIYRLQQNDPPSRIVDWYTKSGDLGTYSSQLFLSPDHNAGFTIITAGKSTAAANLDLTFIVGLAVTTALETAARAEAVAAYTGTYKASNSTNLNSSVTITAEDGKPGLGVSRLISNGTDVLAALPLALGATEISIRLYPSNLRNPSKNEVEFIAVFDEPGQGGPFGCRSWVSVDAQLYGGISLDQFVLKLGENGKAVNVQPRVLRVTLERE